MGEPELEDEGADELDGRQHARPNVLVADAIVQDGRRHKHAHRKADVVDHRRVELEGHPRSAQAGNDQPYRRQSDDQGGGSDNRVSRPIVAHDQKDAGNNQREKD